LRGLQRLLLHLTHWCLPVAMRLKLFTLGSNRNDIVMYTRNVTHVYQCANAGVDLWLWESIFPSCDWQRMSKSVSGTRRRSAHLQISRVFSPGKAYSAIDRVHDRKPPSPKFSFEGERVTITICIGMVRWLTVMSIHSMRHVEGSRSASHARCTTNGKCAKNSTYMDTAWTCGTFASSLSNCSDQKITHAVTKYESVLAFAQCLPKKRLEGKDAAGREWGRTVRCESIKNTDRGGFNNKCDSKTQRCQIFYAPHCKAPTEERQTKKRRKKLRVGPERARDGVAIKIDMKKKWVCTKFKAKNWRQLRRTGRKQEHGRRNWHSTLHCCARQYDTHNA